MTDSYPPTEMPSARPDSFWQSELNESQWGAVRECEHPLLVIAGAGSGKTRVLTYKIAYLLERGYAPWAVLALTFTNKAAKEMNERISSIVGIGKSRGLWSGTFHSIFARILRAESQFIGFENNFTIYDSSDARSLIKSIIKELKLDDKTYKPSKVQGRISDAKNRLMLPQVYAADTHMTSRDARDNMPDVHRIYTEYFKRCRTSRAMDFDDLLLYTFLLFDKAEEVRKKYAQRFRYILVDEYQDTNYAQHAIVNLLTKDNHHICVVGDDAQSIYSFRGANIDNILQFNRQYPEAITLKLERNYRSTQNIVDAANSIIRHNKEQIEKTVFSENEKGDKILLMPSSSDKEEASKVIGHISRLHRSEDVALSEIAILYRTNAQSRSFEDALREKNIPYRIYGGLSFYQRKEIKDIIAYFRLVTNLNDEEAFKRIVNYPARGIGNTTLQKIFTASREHNVSLWAVAEQPTQYGVALNKGTLSKLESFCNIITDFRSRVTNMGAFDFATELLQYSGIKEDLQKEDGPEGQSKRENVEELLGAIRSFERETTEETGRETIVLSEFLQQSALQTDADEQDDDTPKVTLMTIHSAKGLEFEAVFVTGLEDGLFPGSQARFFPREMEEERRLFYVAVTRAKRFCFLSYAQSRFRYGQFEISDPSPFIAEINQKFIQEEQVGFAHNHSIPSALREALMDDDWETPSVLPSTRIAGSAIYTKPTKRQTQDVASGKPLKASATHVSRSSASSSDYASTLKPIRKAQSKSSNAAQKAAINALSVGSNIEHERFGKGSIVSIEGSGENAKAEVDFQAVGRKKLLLKFALFKILD